jgi:hypothetical protein
MLLLQGEGVHIALSLALLIAGGAFGSIFIRVTSKFRRVTYLWWLVGANLILIGVQFCWILLPLAATYGVVSLLSLFIYASPMVFGAAIYFGSAARSIHITGNAKHAWMGFVPFLNLWLMFATPDAGSVTDQAERSRFGRMIADPLLVISAIAVLGVNKTLEAKLDQIDDFVFGDMTAIQTLFAEVLSVEELFVEMVVTARADLPRKVDTYITFQSIESEGDTLRLGYRIDETEATVSAASKDVIASALCAPDSFGSLIARGGKVIQTFRTMDGRVMAEFVITNFDCTT